MILYIKSTVNKHTIQYNNPCWQVTVSYFWLLYSFLDPWSVVGAQHLFCTLFIINTVTSYFGYLFSIFMRIHSIEAYNLEWQSHFEGIVLPK